MQLLLLIYVNIELASNNTDSKYNSFLIFFVNITILSNAIKYTERQPCFVSPYFQEPRIKEKYALGITYIFKPYTICLIFY
jgi:hypothetical protein